MSESNAPRWKLRYAGHLGLRGPDLPLFRHSAASTDPVDQIAFLAGIGFAGVQDNFLKLRPAAEQLRIGQALADHGLRMGSFNNNPAHWNRPLWCDESEAARAILAAELDDSIAAAARTGARHLTCVTGDPGDTRPGAHRAALSSMARNLRRLADRASDADLVLCVEPVAAAWIPGLLVATLDDALTVIREAAHPAVRLLFDVAHIETSDGEAFARLSAHWDAVALVQAADTPGRRDLGSGSLDWAAILAWLHAEGYAGLVEIEHQASEDSAAGEQALLERLRVVDAG
ncbi:MAG: TIM barrel protein [Gammaproteobacteria bacterium]